MTSIADNLSLVGKPVDEDNLVTLILNGLGTKCDSTIDSVQARETPITLADLHGLLLNAEMCHEDNEPSTQLEGTTTALYSSKNGPF